MTAAVRRLGERARQLDGVPFAVAVWVAWRLAQQALALLNGSDPLLAVWTLDGDWYRTILDKGYDVVDGTFRLQQNVAFFPGLVWLAEPFSWVLSAATAAHLVATLTSLGAFLGLHQATAAVTGDAVAARRAVVALAIWPTSVVMTAFYSEGLLIAATTWGIWALRRDRTPIALGAALVAGVTRSVGVALGPALAVGRVIARRRVDAVAVTYALAGPMSLGIVALTQQVTTGHALGFLDAQRAWGREPAPPWVAIAEGAREMFDVLGDAGPWVPWAIDLVVVAGTAIVLGFLTRRVWQARSGLTEPAARAGWSALLVWGWAAWYSPLLTNTITSATRFALGVWPAFVAVSMARSPDRRRIVRGLLAACYVVSVLVGWVWAEGQLNPLYT